MCIYIYICCCFRCFLHQLMNALAADMTTATWENSQKVFRTWTKTQLLHAGAVLDIAVCLVATLCQIMSFRAQWTDCVASCRRELTDCGCQWREALKNRPLFSSNVRGGGWLSPDVIILIWDRKTSCDTARDECEVSPRWQADAFQGTCAWRGDVLGPPLLPVKSSFAHAVVGF